MNEDFSEVISKFKDILDEKDVKIPNMNVGEKSEDTGNSSEKTLGFDIDIGTILKIKNMIDIAKEKTNAWTDRNMDTENLGSQMEKSQPPEAQSIYFIQLNRDVGLLHTAESRRDI